MLVVPKGKKFFLWLSQSNMYLIHLYQTRSIKTFSQNLQKNCEDKSLVTHYPVKIRLYCTSKNLAYKFSGENITL